MARNNPGKSNIRKFSCGGLLLATLGLTAVTFALSADDRQIETIDATAMGTSTQLGKNVSVKATIYEYSTDEDRQILIDAFKKGQNQGLVNRSCSIAVQFVLLGNRQLCGPGRWVP